MVQTCHTWLPKKEVLQSAAHPQQVPWLQQEGIRHFISGDFNAHIGSPAESNLGIKGNNPKIGHNGTRLLHWMSQHGKTTLNSQPFTKGLWTYQRHDGKCFSALDFILCGKSDLKLVKGFEVDESREYTQINNDHNLIVSLIDANYSVVQWPKPKPILKWDISNINKNKYKSVLKKKLQTSQDIGVAKGVEYDKCVVSRLNDICTAVNEALSASTKLSRQCKSIFKSCFL